MSHNKEFDEDDLLDEELQEAPIYSPEIEQEAESRALQVRTLLSRGSIQEALKVALDSPMGTRDPQKARESRCQYVMEVLLAVRSNDIPALLPQLSEKDIDVLTKFIYKGLSLPERYSSAVLLSWHDKVVDTAGLGTIVRAMTDRRIA